MTDPTSPRRKTVFGALRASFLTGLVVVLPVGLTIYLIWTVVGWIDGWILPLIPSAYQPEALLERYFGPEANYPVRGVGVIVFLIFTIFIGWIAKGLIGRSMIGWAERLVDRMPIVRSIYNGIKQIAETMFNKSDASFDKTCLVEFPRPGVWALGFVSSKAKGEIAAKLPRGDDVISVFIGLTPFTSGFLVFVPRSEVILLDMSMDDAAKMVVSGGLVYPATKDASERDVDKLKQRGV
ncbi:MAG: DUF502 domain-containing protein [Paracoccaceae bacterium]